MTSVSESTELRKAGGGGGKSITGSCSSANAIWRGKSTWRQAGGLEAAAAGIVRGAKSGQQNIK